MKTTRQTDTLELRELGEAVARRTRSLIAPAPILELEANKSQRDLDLSQHDLRMLCLVVLDVVIDKMGFGTGATRRDVEFSLSPMLQAAEPGIAEEFIFFDHPSGYNRIYSAMRWKAENLKY